MGVGWAGVLPVPTGAGSGLVCYTEPHPSCPAAAAEVRGDPVPRLGEGTGIVLVPPLSQLPTLSEVSPDVLMGAILDSLAALFINTSMASSSSAGLASAPTELSHSSFADPLTSSSSSCEGVGEGMVAITGASLLMMGVALGMGAWLGPSMVGGGAEMATDVSMGMSRDVYVSMERSG